MRPHEFLHLGLQRVAQTSDDRGELDTYKAVKNERLGPDGGPAVALPPAYQSQDLPRIFADAEQKRRRVAEKVVADTPDPFINAAVAALSVSGDSVWDESQGVFMHGAVAWRSKLLGWRGPYVGDALGWHDRARRHFTYWAGQQNTTPFQARRRCRTRPSTSRATSRRCTRMATCRTLITT